MNHRTRSTLWACVALAAAGSPLAADQVVLTPSKDNTIFSDPPGTLSDARGSFIFAGKTGAFGAGAVRRALLAFDLSTIPTASTVTSVTLTLRLSKAPFGSGVRTVSISRVAADWGEGTSAAFGNEGMGTAATTGDATWFQRFFGSADWASAGGDFAGTPSASADIPETLGDYLWGPTPAMVADVLGWLASPATNFGWIVIGDESVPTTARRFNSRENLDATSVPRLTVTFTPPAGCYPNCDNSTTAPVLNVQDFSCFLTRYAAGDAYANCDGSTTAPILNVQDFSCFLTRYAAGCP